MVFKILLLFALISIQSINSYLPKPCEKKFLKECNQVFIKTWHDANEKEEAIQVFCRAYQSIGNCLSSESKPCKGKLIDLFRMVIAEYMTFNKKTDICPDFRIGALKHIVDENVDRQITDENLSKVVSDKVEACAYKISEECTTSIANNMKRDLKNTQCLANDAANLFKCYESKQNKCNARIYLDWLNTMETYGKLVNSEETKFGMRRYCNV